MQRSKESLVDDLVGAGEQQRRDGETKRLRGLQIDHQLEFSGLYDRQVGGLGALENFSDVDACLTIAIRNAWSVACQTAGERSSPGFISRRNAHLGGKRHQLLTPAVHEWTRSDKERMNPARSQYMESVSNLAFVARLHLLNREAERACRLIHIGLESPGRAEVGIDESSDGLGMRKQLMQKLEPLRCQFAR